MVNQKLLSVMPPTQSSVIPQLNAPKDDDRNARATALYRTAREVAAIVAEQPGVAGVTQARAYLTGGWVRDKVLGRPCVDIDMEVFGMDRSTLVEVLKTRLPYGVISPSDSPTAPIKIIVNGEAALDVTIPLRSESTRDPGGVGYVAAPGLSLVDATKRRDFTCNAIYFDPIREEYHDPAGGIEDLARGVLRLVPDLPQAVIDSGAPLRACRFLAQHSLALDSGTEKLLVESVRRDSLNRLPKPFVTKELRKILCECAQPSQALRNAERLGVLGSLFPQLAGLRQIPQDPRHHPEGDALEHTFLVTDAAAAVSREQSVSERFKVMLAAFFHDVGKLTHTQIRGEGNAATITAHGHERASARIASEMLKKISMNSVTKTEVLRMVANHMRPLELESRQITDRERFDNQVRQLVRDVHPADFGSFLMVCRADRLGRANSHGVKGMSGILAEIEKSVDRCNFLADPRSRLLKGADLSHLGFTELGVDFGEVLQAVEASRDAGSLKTKEDAERYVLRRFAMTQIGREVISACGPAERERLFRTLNASIKSNVVRNLEDAKSLIEKFLSHS
jgi:tRNA nucleotidyltransferase (CCA-adding enzyme)